MFIIFQGHLMETGMSKTLWVSKLYIDNDCYKIRKILYTNATTLRMSVQNKMVAVYVQDCKYTNQMLSK